MSTGVMNVPNGFVVVTHVQPVGNGNGQVAGPTVSTFGHSFTSAMEKFKKGHPVALGTVQIMIGAWQLLIGIVIATHPGTLGVFSGIFVWGSIIYIVAGSLTVAAGNKTNRCMVNASLGLNIVASMSAGCGIILYSVDAAVTLDYYCRDWECMATKQGITILLLIFSLLELIVSIYVSGFACKATCNSFTEHQVFITGVPSPQVMINPVAPQELNAATNQPETMPVHKDQEGLADPTLAQVGEQPPKYTPS